MVAILAYVLLGILIYVVGIPILEELATVIVQGLEVLKGKLVLSLTKIQDKANEFADKKATSSTHVIGFAIPTEEDEDDDYDEEEEEDNDD